METIIRLKSTNQIGFSLARYNGAPKGATSKQIAVLIKKITNAKRCQEKKGSVLNLYQRLYFNLLSRTAIVLSCNT